MDTGFQHIMIMLSFSALMAAMILALIRLIRGPGSSDRIIALDQVAFVVMGFILVYSVMVRKAVYFDVAIVISLISFIGTVAISNYLRQK